jgi:hypothetical protein
VHSYSKAIYNYCFISVLFSICSFTCFCGGPFEKLKADSHIACRAHAVPLPCRAAKGLESVFPIWFTQCGRVWFIKMWSVSQTRLHCVNQTGKTHSKPLAARHGRGTAWARHAMCESALIVSIYGTRGFVIFVTRFRNLLASWKFKFVAYYLMTFFNIKCNLFTFAHLCLCLQDGPSLQVLLLKLWTYMSFPLYVILHPLV